MDLKNSLEKIRQYIKAHPFDVSAYEDFFSFAFALKDERRITGGKSYPLEPRNMEECSKVRRRLSEETQA